MVQKEKLSKKIAFRAIVYECYKESEKQLKLASEHNEFEKAHRMEYHCWSILAHHFEALAQDPTYNLEQLTFIEVLIDAENKYQRRIPIYAESWKTMPLLALENRLWTEIKEWGKSIKDLDKRQELKELLDIINVASMLATRLKKEKEER